MNNIRTALNTFKARHSNTIAARRTCNAASQADIKAMFMAAASNATAATTTDVKAALNNFKARHANTIKAHAL